MVTQADPGLALGLPHHIPQQHLSSLASSVLSVSPADPRLTKVSDWLAILTMHLASSRASGIFVGREKEGINAGHSWK
jgi:hypothetical protein